MPVCKRCGDEVEQLVAVKADGKKQKVCESCAEDLEASEAVAEESEAVVQRMMDFRGRR